MSSLCLKSLRPKPLQNPGETSSSPDETVKTLRALNDVDLLKPNTGASIDVGPRDRHLNPSS